MKSRKVKAAARSKGYISKKKLKGNIPLEADENSGPDVDSDSFYHDDIDDFHRKEDEKLSTDDEFIDFDDDSSEEEEVLPITDDEKDELNEENQVNKFESEGEEEDDDDLPNPEAWGKKKSSYYNADFVDEDRGRTYREDDAEAARAEAEEAFAIQKSLFKSISADHLGANLLLEGSSESSEDEEEKTHDLGSATKQEKLKFLKKTCPELLVFIQEFKEKISELKDKFEPLLALVRKGDISSEHCVNYIKTKHQLLNLYCLNISYYMVLKSCGSVVTNHPILQRISSYRKLLDDLKCVDERAEKEINLILEKLQQNEDIIFEISSPIISIENQMAIPNGSIPKAPDQDAVMETKKSKKKKCLETDAEKEIFSLYLHAKEQQKKAKEIVSDTGSEMEETKPMEEDISEEKRTITYQIAKNKGLVAHRKKEYRNPRVRHRMKFRKAKIRRKGQVRDVIREIKKYEGEPTGISTHVVKSIKLK